MSNLYKFSNHRTIILLLAPAEIFLVPNLLWMTGVPRSLSALSTEPVPPVSSTSFLPYRGWCTLNQPICQKILRSTSPWNLTDSHSITASWYLQPKVKYKTAFLSFFMAFVSCVQVITWAQNDYQFSFGQLTGSPFLSPLWKISLMCYIQSMGKLTKL